ncbi:response regulator [Geminicoccaceae bacterium SYSU G07066]|uniref:Response regulator n=2 Tax=Benzoatithermus flavus TaxID=3108223 RepID=A0ABU8XTX1_9PROT
MHEAAAIGQYKEAPMALILYVEDNEDNLYMLKSRLERRGHTVLVARDGRAGVEAARAERPDLVLLDLSLPVLDGWEAARLLKDDALTRAIPIIALSAHAMAGDRSRALGAGCNDYDTKPVDFTRLLGRIKALLHRGPGS